VSRTLIESDATLKIDPSQKGTWSAHGCNEMDVMSALGQKQTSGTVLMMSALPPKADIRSGTLAMGAKAGTRQRRVLTTISGGLFG
jgi:hypothetical protein